VHFHTKSMWNWHLVEKAWSQFRTFSKKPLCLIQCEKSHALRKSQILSILTSNQIPKNKLVHKRARPGSGSPLSKSCTRKSLAPRWTRPFIIRDSRQWQGRRGGMLGRHRGEFQSPLSGAARKVGGSHAIFSTPTSWTRCLAWTLVLCPA
jgi:hypothetical protein